MIFELYPGEFNESPAEFMLLFSSEHEIECAIPLDFHNDFTGVL